MNALKTLCAVVLLAVPMLAGAADGKSNDDWLKGRLFPPDVVRKYQQALKLTDAQRQATPVLPLKVGSLPRVLPIGAVRRSIAGARGRITAGIVIVIVGALTGRRLTVIGRHSAVCGSAERIVLLVHGVVSPLYLRSGS